MSQSRLGGKVGLKAVMDLEKQKADCGVCFTFASHLLKHIVGMGVSKPQSKHASEEK